MWPDMNAILIKPADAAKLLGIGKSFLYLLMASGQIASVKIGKSRRIPVAALKSWVEAKTAEQARTRPIPTTTTP